MADEQGPAPGLRQRLRRVLRDDLHLTSIGFGFTAILLTAMAAAAWWAGHTQDTSLHQARAERVRTIGATLARTTDALLADARLSRVRRLVVETAREANLSRCRLLLPSGEVVADARPEAITRRDLPPTWDGDALPPRPGAGRLCRTFPVTVPNRGTLLLQVAAAPDPADDLFWQMRAGIGAVCVVALVVLVLMHRRFRSTFRGIWAVRRAVLAHRDGQCAPEALKVHAAWGVEAEAWNSLMDQMEQAQRRTTLTRTEESLRLQHHSSNDLSAACDALAQGLILVDPHCRAKYLNSAAAVLLQAKRDQVVEADIADFIKDDQVVEAVRQATRRPMQRRQIFAVERTGSAGHVLLRFIVRPVRREDSAVAMVVIEDITQQRVARDAQNTFLAQATHELRTPLTNIRAYAEMGMDDGKDDPAVQANCLSTINQEVCRLDRIVGDILSVSEIEAGSLRLNVDDVRLDDLLASLEANYAAQAKEKQIALAFDLPPKLPVLRGDREKIALGFHNLLGNALKYTPEGGKVTATIKVDDGQLTVVVTDTGIGMNEEDRGRIFEKFYRSPDRRVTQIEGSGLGLAIAREVIRMHGGDITVESEIDQGSTFTLTLPVTEGVPVA
ncbi:MAG: ATP-binding protein [Planctomycetota bacterium]|nr:ATP-binding protein [Planctomycetota bacterium]